MIGSIPKNRICSYCNEEKELNIDNFQVVNSFRNKFSYYCNPCDIKSKKQKVIENETN